MAPLCCEWTPVVCSDSLIALLCPHVSRATGVASPLCLGPHEDERKAGGLGGVVELILAQATDFWVELDLSVFQLHLAQDTEGEVPAPAFLAHMVQNKQVGLDIFSLAGLPLALGKK